MTDQPQPYKPGDVYRLEIAEAAEAALYAQADNPEPIDVDAALAAHQLLRKHGDPIELRRRVQQQAEELLNQEERP